MFCVGIEERVFMSTLFFPPFLIKYSDHKECLSRLNGVVLAFQQHNLKCGYEILLVNNNYTKGGKVKFQSNVGDKLVGYIY